MLEAVLAHLRVDVLVDAASQCHHHHLYAAANAQHGYLAVVGQTRDHQFLLVAFEVDAMQTTDRLLTHEQWVHVCPATQKDAVEAVEQVGEDAEVVVWWYDYGYSTCFKHGAVVRLVEEGVEFAVIARDADQRTALMGLETGVQAVVGRSPVEILHGMYGLYGAKWMTPPLPLPSKGRGVLGCFFPSKGRGVLGCLCPRWGV